MSEMICVNRWEWWFISGCNPEMTTGGSRPGPGRCRRSHHFQEQYMVPMVPEVPLAWSR